MCKWTIGILTIPQRWNQLDRLTNSLIRQVRETRADVEILIADQDGGIGEKRQWCLDHADGDYFNFIDDDDSIADDYVSTIYPLLDGVDYIGFRLQLYIDGMAQKPTFHSLQFTHWYDDNRGYFRNVSHLNPMRTEIARQGSFIGNYGEDYEWAKHVRPETEYFIPRTMYFYYYQPTESAALKLKEMEIEDRNGRAGEVGAAGSAGDREQGSHDLRV